MQIKGGGEVRPILTPTDEFAGCETWDKGNLDLSQAKTAEMLSREYARALEIPTPRWVVYAAYRFGTPLPADAALKGNERTYTRPIWFTP